MVYHNKAKPPVIADFSGLDLLMASVTHDYQTFNVCGVDVPQRAPTILQLIRLCKRFPSLLSIFDGLMGSKPVDFVTALFDAGDEAVAAFVAYSVDQEGNREFEAEYAAKPDKLTRPMVANAKNMMFGERGIDVFFDELIQELLGQGLIEAPKSKKSGQKTA